MQIQYWIDLQQRPTSSKGKTARNTLYYALNLCILGRWYLAKRSIEVGLVSCDIYLCFHFWWYAEVVCFTQNLNYRYPSYCGSNIWPDVALPELEVGMLPIIIWFSWLQMLDVIHVWRLTFPMLSESAFVNLTCAAFKALGKLILNVGFMLAYHCDRYGNFFSLWMYMHRST